MNPTEQQRAAIDARGKVIVSASAGSGKTHVMIERFISILRSGEANVREILAVTFTNKAAAQMRDRARKKLTEAYRAAEGEERMRLKRQLDDLPLADISTIHSFCARLVRTYFYLVGVDPRFTIADGEQAEGRATSARALELAFEEAYEEGGEWFPDLLAAYFKKNKDESLRKMVLELYGKMRNTDRYLEILQETAAREATAWKREEIGDPRAFLAGQEDDAKAELGKIVRSIAEDRMSRAAEIARKASQLLQCVQEYAPRAEALVEAVSEAASKIAGAKDLFAMYEAAESFSVPRSPARRPSDPPETLHAIGQAQLLSKQVKELYAEFKGGAPDWREEFMRFAEGRSRAAALARLVLLYDGEYTRLKREAGFLDYGDLEHLALAVLKKDEARDAVRKSYRFVFVDEYQDVNPMQGEILKTLTGEEFFVVGDKKQAIYGFRGSRTGYFTKMEEECGGALLLDRNFRSAEGILDAVNTVFSAVYCGKETYPPMLGGDRYGSHRGETIFHTVEKLKKEKKERGVYSVAEAEGRKAEHAVARRVLSIIKSECGLKGKPAKLWFDADKGEETEVGYGDIAVLVRKNSGTAGAIVRALSENGIPVTSSAGVNICDFFEVRLLIDWLSLLDNGEQDIPLASAMLSGIGGFSERELALIRIRANEMHLHKVNFRTAARAAAKDKKRAGEALSAKLNAFFEKVEKYRTLSRTATASEMLSILLADGLEAQIAGMGGGKAVLAHVRRLVSESADAGSTHEILRRLKDADEKILFSESGGEGAVRVLTMHAAKGLEFPVVIVADLDTAFHGADHDEMMWTEAFGIAPRSFDFENKVRYETLARRAAEICMLKEENEGERNLLYVAMTRAMYRLHLIFESEAEGKEGFSNVNYSPDRAKKLSDFIPRDRMLSLLAPLSGEEEEDADAAKETAAGDPAAAMEICAAIKPYPYEAATLLPVKSSATCLIRDAQEQEKKQGYHVRDDEEKETPISDMDAVFSTETGLAYHAFLEHVRFGADAKEELSRMKEEHLLTTEQISLLNEERLDAILKMPRLAALKGKTVWREQQFLVTLPAEEFYEGGAGGEVIFQGALDLLAEEEEGLLIIDYKFSSRERAGIREHYAPQIRLYKKAVAKIRRIPEEDVRAVILNIARLEEIAM